jgi:hypothetical protein
MPSPTQLEFTFAPQVSCDMRVDRLADGRVLLTPSAEVRAWGSTADAAEAIGKSRQWVRDALEAGVLRGEKIGKCWRVDLIHLQEMRTKARNW